MTIFHEKRVVSPATWDFDVATIVSRLEAYLSAQLACPIQIEDFVRLTGGLSWITGTFVVRTASPHDLNGRVLVVKIGSPRGLMAPYSAEPQAMAMRIFADYPEVPVPNLLWCSDDLAILGAPFLITSKVEGAELNPFVPGIGLRNPGDRDNIGAQFAGVLGAMHAVDPGDDHGQARSAGARYCGVEQVDSWQRRYESWASRSYPVIELAASWLRRHSPAAARVVVVHGDYRIGNFLVHAGRITAVLDWEMAHFGDPHEDLSWAMMPEVRLTELISHGDFIARYQARSGLQVLPESMRYYRILTLYKLVMINLGGLRASNAAARICGWPVWDFSSRSI